MNFFVSNTSEKSCAFWKQHLLEPRIFWMLKQVALRNAHDGSLQIWYWEWRRKMRASCPTYVESTTWVSYTQCENLWDKWHLFWNTQAFAWLHSPDGTNCIHCIYVVVGIVSTLEMVYNKAYMQVSCHFIYYPYFSVYFLFFEAGFHSVM